MELKQNPFSLYDFLGYFTPGAIFLYCILLALGHLETKGFSLAYVNTYLSFEKAEIYIPFILAAYLSGHFLSFLSSITIERFSLWAHGYPSKYLLGITHKGYFSATDHEFLRVVIRLLVFLILAPISLLDLLLGRVIGMRELYAKKLDPLLIEVLRKRIEALIEKHAGIKNKEKYGAARDTDFFRYAYHYALENAPSHITKMQNYVALYGFLRTLTLIVLITFWVVVWHVLNGAFATPNAIWTMFIVGVIAYLFFMGFVKFYRRFSLEALMAMAVTYKPEGPTTGSRRRRR
jgi:hypothetical protein